MGFSIPNGSPGQHCQTHLNCTCPSWGQTRPLPPPHIPVSVGKVKGAFISRCFLQQQHLFPAQSSTPCRGDEWCSCPGPGCMGAHSVYVLLWHIILLLVDAVGVFGPLCCQIWCIVFYKSSWDLKQPSCTDETGSRRSSVQETLGSATQDPLLVPPPPCSPMQDKLTLSPAETQPWLCCCTESSWSRFVSQQSKALFEIRIQTCIFRSCYLAGACRALSIAQGPRWVLGRLWCSRAQGCCSAMGLNCTSEPGPRTEWICHLKAAVRACFLDGSGERLPAIPRGPSYILVR